MSPHKLARFKSINPKNLGLLKYSPTWWRGVYLCLLWINELWAHIHIFIKDLINEKESQFKKEETKAKKAEKEKNLLEFFYSKKNRVLCKFVSHILSIIV